MASLTQEDWTRLRWQARTDLLYLCKILGYKDVSREVHFPVLDLVQKFPLPSLAEQMALDTVRMGQTNYTANHSYRPYKPMRELEGSRRRLVLDPRSFLKTTVNTIAHSVQWILNYPHIAIWLCQSNLEKAQEFLGEVKYHFQSNEAFRALFPDYCPQGRKISDWGNMDRFSVPNKDAVTKLAGVTWHREPTMLAGSIEKSATGLHFDVIKFSDIVDEKNTITDEQVNKIKQNFFLNENLLVDPQCWIDVEGTCYHFGDVYGTLIDQWHKEAQEGRPHEYQISVRSIFKRTTENPKFTPNELDDPWLLDADGKRISWWPNRFTTDKLESEYARDPWVFATQKLNCPSAGTKTAVFPVVPNEYPKWITRHNFLRNVKVAFRTTTVDLAETVTKRSDYSVITTCAWADTGQCFVEDIKYGRFLPDEVIDLIFKTHIQFQPMRISIESTGYARGLQSSINQVRDRRGVYPHFHMLKRDSKESKHERIQNALQPPYKNGLIIFLEDLQCREQLLNELKRFGGGGHDDILDTLADQFQDRDYFGRLAGSRQPNRADILISEDRGHELHWDAPQAFLEIQDNGMDPENYWTRVGG